jgi:hypothetical protein
MCGHQPDEPHTGCHRWDRVSAEIGEEILFDPSALVVADLDGLTV